MERITVSKELSSEFFTTDGLWKLTGCYQTEFCKVIVKELVDNALDEVESKEHGVIIVSSGKNSFYIWDNGNGIKEETVKGILDFDNGRFGTKMGDVYVSPSRGKQGNAFKTILGIPCSLGLEGTQVLIESCGLKHSISHQRDYGDNVELCYKVEASEITNGTFIRVFWNVLNYDIEQKINPMIENIRYFNPHVSIVSVKNTELDLPTIQELKENLPSKNTLGFEKVRLNDPLDIHWYNHSSFLKLLSKFEKRHPEMKFRRTNGMDKSATFLGLFHKLGNYRSQQNSLPEDFKTVKLLGEIKSFSKDKLENLLDHLQATVKLSKNSIDRLGSIGEDNFKSINNFGHFPCGYVKKTDNQNSFVVELFSVKVDDHEHGGEINWGVNYTACYEVINFNEDDDNSKKINDVIRKLKKQKNIIYAHLIHPNFAYKGYGKNQIHFTEEQLNIISKTFSSLYNKVGKKEVIDDKKTEDKEKEKDIKRKTVKGVIAEIAQEVYDRQSENNAWALTMRNYFYAMRDEIKRRFVDCYYVSNKKKNSFSRWGDQDCHYSSFRTNIYDLMDNDLITVPMLVSDPRGYLYEPYTDTEIKLGTTQVDNYNIPSKQYQGILYIEKENPLLQLKQARIAEKYDILICAGKGYAVRAAKSLLKKCGKKEGFKLFCIHDADPDGYMIYQDLVNKIPDIEIIDLGLSIREAVEDMVIVPEHCSFSDKTKTLINKLNIDEKERSYFLVPQCRVEISVLSPRNFVTWVDRKLSQYLPEKRLPSKEELKEEMKPFLTEKIKRDGKQYQLVLEDRIKDKALKGLRKEMKKVLKPFRRKEERIIKKLMLGRLKPQVDNVIEGKIKELLGSDYVEMVKEKLTENPYQSWTHTIDGIIDNVISDNLPQLKEEIKSIVSKEE